MNDFIIETQIDKLIDLLSKRRKIALSEAARVLNVKESQLDVWVSTLEDRGIVELKYPVLGEPEIVLKGLLPENLIIQKKPEEKIEEIKEVVEIEKMEPPQKLEYENEEIKELSKKIDNLEMEGKEIKNLEEKITNLENKILQVTEEIDIAKLKEELFEALLIIFSLTDIEKITYYLSFIERVVLALKTKKGWDKVDKDLMISSLNTTAKSWRIDGNEDIAKIFEEMAKRIEMI